MYPSRELTALAARKLAVRQRIAVARLECASLAAEAARPIALADRVIVQWRRLSPFVKFAALPLGLLFRRRLVPRSKGGLIRQALRWVPAVLSAVRILQARRSGGLIR